MGFEAVDEAVRRKKILTVQDHPNQQRYPGQKIMIVEINGYARNIPFVEHDGKLFLKTMYPSRKSTALYLSK